MKGEGELFVAYSWQNEPVISVIEALQSLQIQMKRNMGNYFDHHKTVEI